LSKAQSQNHIIKLTESSPYVNAPKEIHESKGKKIVFKKKATSKKKMWELLQIFFNCNGFFSNYAFEF
jgi:hypothetical protein